MTRSKTLQWVNFINAVVGSLALVCVPVLGALVAFDVIGWVWLTLAACVVAEALVLDGVMWLFGVRRAAPVTRAASGS